MVGCLFGCRGCSQFCVPYVGLWVAPRLGWLVGLRAGASCRASCGSSVGGGCSDALHCSILVTHVSTDEKPTRSDAMRCSFAMHEPNGAERGAQDRTTELATANWYREKTTYVTCNEHCYDN